MLLRVGCLKPLESLQLSEFSSGQSVEGEGEIYEKEIPFSANPDSNLGKLKAG